MEFAFEICQGRQESAHEESRMHADHSLSHTAAAVASRRSCAAYRSIVVDHPHFISYFQHATPEAELGNLNIGVCVGGGRVGRRRRIGQGQPRCMDVMQ